MSRMNKLAHVEGGMQCHSNSHSPRYSSAPPHLIQNQRDVSTSCARPGLKKGFKNRYDVLSVFISLSNTLCVLSFSHSFACLLHPALSIYTYLRFLFYKPAALSLKQRTVKWI